MTPKTPWALVSWHSLKAEYCELSSDAMTVHASRPDSSKAEESAVRTKLSSLCHGIAGCTDMG